MGTKSPIGDSIARRRGSAFLVRSLRFDILEPRLAPAGIALVDGELIIDGTDNSDLITVVYEDPADVDGNVVITIRKPNLAVVDEEVVDRDDVESLQVNALGGSDRVFNATDIPDTMEGGEGSDFLQGGSGDSLLIGGNHDDTLAGGLGVDYLLGEDGRDQLFADGYVVFNGRLLPKSLEHAVCDTLEEAFDAILEADALDGGTGDDALYGGPGSDQFVFGGQAAQVWWEQEARDFSDDDEWIYPWLLTDEELEIYLQPDFA
jgi:Ca2+-binding RTX toxin-like protein